MTTEQEAIERGAFQFLIGAAAALEVVPTVADGMGIGVYHDLQKFSAGLLP